jgi:hypothetical protein
LKTPFLRASLLAAVFGCIVAACAAGSSATGELDGGETGDATSGEGGSSMDGRADTSKGGKLPIGAVCMGTSQCAAPGMCTQIGTGSYCSEPCPASCPTGSYCSLIKDMPICVPDLMQECLDCMKDSDCKLPSDACLTAPQGDKFCARDCTPEGDCPTGYECVDKATYAGTKLGGADAGGAGGGMTDGGLGSDGGTLEGGSADDAGDDTGAGGGDGPTKWCVPKGGASCACDADRNGLVENCSVTNQYGTCTGQATCVGATGKLQACNAQAPTKEICNGVDDNCDGQIDEGDPNSLCSTTDNAPANSNWVCMNGACSLGPCAAGFTAFPPGPLSAGCACAVNTGDADGLCDQAIMAGTVTSTSTTPLVITGTLSSATAVAVYQFTATDTNEVTTNSFHVAISFTQPTTNNEFVMDVIQGDPCNDTPTGGSTNITSYDWCVNATNATAGEAPCGPTAVHHCTDHSGDYFVRIYRAAGATPTCNTYELTITGGGGTCDLTATCM